MAYDVLVIGGGLSGIGAGAHLASKCPHQKFAILEAREDIGGTWDLFRYPGIRSDSDMFTLGYTFKPWLDSKSIADGPSILKYIKDTANEYKLEDKILLRHRVVRLEWSSKSNTWSVEVEREGANNVKDVITLTTSFIISCTGYYRYSAGFQPTFPGQEQFQGTLFHPQIWPKDLDYAGKRVVIIGSGATAVTLLPAMAQTAAHVTMLQRSPTYIFARPSEERFTILLRRFLPQGLAYMVIRWILVLQSILLFTVARRQPEKVKKVILKEARSHLPKGYDVEKHFKPSYNPWYQRVCLAPDADFFETIKAGRAAVVTDTIQTFTPTGIRLSSGEDLPADIVISATGLVVDLLSGVREMVVDGQAVDLSKLWFYRGMMFSGVPNLVYTVGYTNASWTLKADLTCNYACRLLNYMTASGYTKCVPVRKPEDGTEALPWADFSSGYIQRSLDKMPKQGLRHPWKLYQNYAYDFCSMKFGNLVDGSMLFSSLDGRPSPAPSLVPTWVLVVALAVMAPFLAIRFL